MQKLRLVGMSAILSVMIWILADQSLSKTASLQVQIVPEAVSGSKLRVAMYGESPIERFEVQVTGKATRLEPLVNEMPLVVYVPLAESNPGVYRLNVVDHLKEHAAKLRSMVIESAVPPTFDVQIDKDYEGKMKIRVFPGALEYEVYPVVEPAHVNVTMSQLDYDKVDAAERFVALFPDDVLRTARRGVLDSTTVPLIQKVGDFQVDLEPDEVTLRYKLKEQFEEATFPAVPIKIEASLEIFNGYVLQEGSSTKILTVPVVVRGPAESIERIRSGEHRLVGVISLSAEDLSNPASYRYREPWFNLPEGCRLVREPEPLEIRLVPRTVSSPESS